MNGEGGGDLRDFKYLGSTVSVRKMEREEN